MDSLALVLTAWLGFGACGFTAGIVGVGLARRRLRSRGEPTVAVGHEELVSAH